MTSQRDLAQPVIGQSQAPPKENLLVLRMLHRVWRISRGLTMGVQGAIIDDRSQFLLIRHGYRPGWHFPGGGVEKKETVRVSLERELQEEVAVQLTGEPQLFGVYANFRVFPNDHVVLFVIREWRQTHIPPPNREIVEQRFFAVDALPADINAATRRRIDEIMNGSLPSQSW